MPGSTLSPATVPALEQRRAEILAQISAIGDLRPGTVTEVFTKCGDPACHCHQDGDRRHGPYFRLVFQADGKRTTRSLASRHVPAVRAEVAECQRLRRLTGELIEVSEQLSEARLRSAAPSVQRAGKKKPARSSSPRPSKPKSPAS